MSDDLDRMRELGYHEMADMMERGRKRHDELVRERQAGEVERDDWCICDDAYWFRGLDDPGCRHDEIGVRQIQIDALTAMTGPELARRLAIADAVLCWSYVCDPHYPLDIAARIIPHLQAIGDRAASDACP